MCPVILVELELVLCSSKIKTALALKARDRDDTHAHNVSAKIDRCTISNSTIYLSRAPAKQLK